MIPIVIETFCIRCRLDTVHVKAKGSNPLYVCDKECGAPWKHISNPSERTPDAIKNRKAAELALIEYYKKENAKTSEAERIARKSAKKRYGHK